MQLGGSVDCVVLHVFGTCVDVLTAKFSLLDNPRDSTRWQSSRVHPARRIETSKHVRHVRRTRWALLLVMLIYTKVVTRAIAYT
jgi:hypothetical protein